MARRWPALDVARAGEPDLLLAVLDDCSPTAVEEHESDVRVFFATSDARDAALAAVSAARYRARAVDVSDEDWAVRSQQNLDPVTVGRLTIVPTAEFLTADRQSAVANRQSSIVNRQFLVVPPSMAFGTTRPSTKPMA